MSVKGIIRHIRNTIVNRIIRIDDQTFFLVSYPRSGNTWMRMLICHLLFPGKRVDFETKEIHAPDFSLQNASLIKSLGRPRIIKSHLYYQKDWRKVIYILRDPRDVLVSLYHYRMRGDQLSGADFHDFVVDYLSWPKEDTWEYHVSSWLIEHHGAPHDLLLLRYEQIVDDPVESARRICAFLELTRTERQLADAVAQSSFEQLRALEVQASPDNSDEAKRFYRKGRYGQWPDYFDEVSLMKFNARVKPVEAKLTGLFSGDLHPVDGVYG